MAFDSVVVFMYCFLFKIILFYVILVPGYKRYGLCAPAILSVTYINIFWVMKTPDGWKLFSSCLTHFRPMFHFYNP